jgi:hypothetical protein
MLTLMGMIRLCLLLVVLGCGSAAVKPAVDAGPEVCPEVLTVERSDTACMVEHVVAEARDGLSVCVHGPGGYVTVEVFRDGRAYVRVSRHDSACVSAERFGSVAAGEVLTFLATSGPPVPLTFEVDDGRGELSCSAAVAECVHPVDTFGECVLVEGEIRQCDGEVYVPGGGLHFAPWAGPAHLAELCVQPAPAPARTPAGYLLTLTTSVGDEWVHWRWDVDGLDAQVCRDVGLPVHEFSTFLVTRAASSGAVSLVLRMAP